MRPRLPVPLIEINYNQVMENNSKDQPNLVKQFLDYRRSGFYTNRVIRKQRLNDYVKRSKRRRG